MQKVARILTPKWIRRKRDHVPVPVQRVMPRTVTAEIDIQDDAISTDNVEKKDNDDDDDDDNLQLALALSLSLSKTKNDHEEIQSNNESDNYKDIGSEHIPDPEHTSEKASGKVKGEHHFDTTCNICYCEMIDNVFMFNCCHLFCLSCCKNHACAKLEESVVDIVCPLCPQSLSQFELRQLLTEQQFERWLQLSLEHHLDRNRHIYFHCPTPDCPSIVEKILFDVVQCPMCNKSACSKCYNDHEENVKCEEYEEWKTLNKDSEKLFKDRVDLGYLIQCTSCLRYIEKSGGCNNMKCRCGNGFTWTGK